MLAVVNEEGCELEIRELFFDADKGFATYLFHVEDKVVGCECESLAAEKPVLTKPAEDCLIENHIIISRPVLCLCTNTVVAQAGGVNEI